MADDNKKDQLLEHSDGLNKPETVIKPQAAGSDSQSEAQKPGDEAELSDSNPASAGRDKPSAVSRLRKFISSSNLYFLIFILLLFLAAAAIFAAVKISDEKPAETTKTGSLTDKQLAELKGSTTVIGDSQQVLDIQSSAVFQSPVLMRNNLDVAGTVKVGGPLSLSAVTVGGVSSFGEVQVNGNLSATSNTTLKNLTVSGTSSFNGTLSVGQLKVTNLELTGDLTITRHLALGGGTPGKTNGTALGSGGTASINGSDTAGTVTINTGGGPPAGCFVTLNFVQKFNSTPHVIISPANSSSAGLNYYTDRSATSFSVCTTTAPAASTTYLFDYLAID